MLTVRPASPARPHPARGLLRQPQQLPAYDIGVVDVAGEGLLGADALVRLVRHDPAVVPAPRQGVQVRRRRPGRAPAPGSAPGCSRCRRRCAGRAGSAPPRSSPPPPTARRPAAGAGRPPRRRPGRRAGRRACSGSRRAWRRTCVLATPTEQVMPCSSATRSRISWPISAGPAEPADRAGHVEERLVQRQRLDQRRDRAEDLHHAGGHRGVQPVAGVDHGGLRAQPPGPAHRHRGVDAVPAGLVGRGEHHAARRRRRRSPACRAARAGRSARPRRRTRPCRRAGRCSRCRRRAGRTAGRVGPAAGCGSSDGDASVRVAAGQAQASRGRADVQLGRDGPEVRQVARWPSRARPGRRPRRARSRRGARDEVGDGADAVHLARPAGRPPPSRSSSPGSVNRRGIGSPGPSGRPGRRGRAAPRRTGRRPPGRARPRCGRRRAG